MKRKLLSQSFALVILVSSLLGCQLENSTGEGEGMAGNWLSYRETQCADPWGYCNKSPDKTVCVKEYLQNLGVTVLETKIEGSYNSGPSCAACQCGSGRIIKVRVNPEDVDEVVAVGFSK